MVPQRQHMDHLTVAEHPKHIPEIRSSSAEADTQGDALERAEDLQIAGQKFVERSHAFLREFLDAAKRHAGRSPADFNRARRTLDKISRRIRQTVLRNFPHVGAD